MAPYSLTHLDWNGWIYILKSNEFEDKISKKSLFNFFSCSKVHGYKVSLKPLVWKMKNMWHLFITLTASWRNPTNPAISYRCPRNKAPANSILFLDITPIIHNEHFQIRLQQVIMFLMQTGNKKEPRLD